MYSKKIAEENSAERKRKAALRKQQSQNFTGRIRIENDTNFLVTIAQCCKPVPGDPIVGYVSHSRGITVHRADCLTFLRIPSIQERSVAVEWDTSTDKKQEKKDKLLEQKREKSRQKQIEKNQYKKQR